MIEEPLDEPINAVPTYAPLIEAERAAEADAADDNKGRGVLRFYELAKKQEWQVRDLPGARSRRSRKPAPAPPGSGRSAAAPSGAR